MRVCDIRCDISLKIRLFYILITNIMSNSNKYCSKKKKKKKVVNLQIGGVRSVHSNITPDSFV